MNISDPPAAAIYGLAGTTLSDEEHAFFADARPLGFILFARNIDTPDQVKRLCADLAALCACDPPMILIDQEGGRVQRLGPPQWPAYPALKAFGDVYRDSPKRAADAVQLNHQMIADDLRKLGITVDCAPVLDVPVPGAHDVIGDRAFSEDPAVVRALAGPACRGLLAGGVAPVIKHLPGHGRAMSDSHKDLPRISADLETLQASDFVPFKDFSDAPCFAMTAHVVLEAVDPDRPVTISVEGIERVIRGILGFKGLLMSDDIGMQALSGSFAGRTAACLKAGCDVVLHCSGDLDEMKDVASAAGTLSDTAWSAVQSVLRAAHASSGHVDHGAAEVSVRTALNGDTV